MISKPVLFAAAALATTTVVASAADMPVKAPRVVEQPQQVSGYGELYGGWSRAKEDRHACSIGGGGCGSESISQNGWTLGGAGRATWWWAPNYSLQLDAQGEGTSYKHPNGGSSFQRISSHSYLIGAHANWRDPQRGLFGIFGGAGDATNFFTFSSVRHGLIGAEGQVYWGPVTLYGQAGYNSTLDSLSSTNFDSFHAWFVRGTARVYVNPNFRIEGTVFYADGDVDFVNAGNTLDFQTWLWRAKAEYKFASSPFSIFAAYEGSRTKFDRTSPSFIETPRVTDHRIVGGIRLYLNEHTLQFNDRNGTTLDIIAPFSVPSFILSRGNSV